MYEIAYMQKYYIDQTGTSLIIYIPNVNLQEQIIQKKINKLGIWIEDGRHITSEQRKKIYATVADISAYTGYLPEEQKEWLKYLHIAITGCKYFSLSNCTIDTAREFINTMLDYALKEGVQLSELGINRTDDIGKYLYMCIKHKKCAICGLEKSDIHHWDAIGMGNNRNTYDDSENRKISLCRIHHTEAHTIGINEFNKKYHVYGIKYTE